MGLCAALPCIAAGEFIFIVVIILYPTKHLESSEWHKIRRTNNKMLFMGCENLMGQQKEKEKYICCNKLLLQEYDK